MNHLSTFIEQYEQTETKPTKRHYQLVDSQIDDMVLNYQRLKKLQGVEKVALTLSVHQIRFMDLFESQCDQLKKETTATGFAVFKLRYLEIPNQQKSYDEIAPLLGYGNGSTPRRMLKQVRLIFIKQLVESGVAALYLNEIAPQSQLPELSVSDLLQAYESIKKNSKCRECRSKSKNGGGVFLIFDN